MKQFALYCDLNLEDKQLKIDHHSSHTLCKGAYIDIHPIEFFLLEYCRIHRISRILFLVILKMKITKNSLIQILQIV